MDKVIGELGCTMDAKFAHIRTSEFHSVTILVFLTGLRADVLSTCDQERQIAEIGFLTVFGTDSTMLGFQ